MRDRLKKIRGNKTLKYTYLVSVHLMALVGLIFVGVFFAIRLKLTNVSGSVDSLSNDFQEKSMQTQVLADTDQIKIASASASDDLAMIEKKIDELSRAKEIKVHNLCALSELSYVAPKNVKKIIETDRGLHSDKVVSQMIFAIENHLDQNADYNDKVKNCESSFDITTTNEETISARIQNSDSQNILGWPDKKEWSDVEASIVKDQEVINKAAAKVDIEPRTVVSSLMVEQLRLFYSQRELYKKYFEPLKILANSNKISLGVMAIKEETAQAIEAHLKDRTSPYYLGPQYEHLLDYSETQDPATERYNRLTSFDHYYNYLYGAIYLKEMMTQWERAGYDITDRPEIVATLFNVGFPQSKPNATPKVGGSTVKIDQTEYSFGRLAYEFYFSGELENEFPIKSGL